MGKSDSHLLVDKKLVLLLLMAILLAGGAFAQNFRLSAGGGVILGPSFAEWKGSDSSTKYSGFDFGINAFFDATYAEVNLGLLFNTSKSDIDSARNEDSIYLTLGLLGKYPFSLNYKLALFPFIGIEYNIGLGSKYDGEATEFDDFSMADYMNCLSLSFGAGVDFSLTNALYLRGEIGFAIVFNTKVENGYADALDETIFKGRIPIKLAAGYRF